MPRILPDWITAFEEYTKTGSSPEPFRTWGAIATIAGALERKVWTVTQSRAIYPNIYAFLVGPPGVGKSMVTSTAQNLWAGLTTQYVSSNDLSKAALIDQLNDAVRSVTIKGQGNLTFNSLKILTNELATLLSSYDASMMAVLTDLYDCGPYYEKKRSMKEPIEIPKAQLNMLVATTPSQLNELLPEGAWQQGFTSRALFIYSDEQVIAPLFDTPEVNEKLWKALRADLRDIAAMTGEFTFTPAAAEMLNNWHMAGGPPSPDHPKLQHYKPRRTVHLIKLAQIICASSATDRIIHQEHIERSLAYLLQAEREMPELFRNSGGTAEANVAKELLYFAQRYFISERKPVPEAKLVGFLQERVPPYQVMTMLDLMEKNGAFRASMVNKVGKCYTPVLPQ